VSRALELDDFASAVPPGMAAVQSASFSPDGAWLGYLRPQDGADLLDLHVFDCASRTGWLALRGAEPATPRPLAEQLARERSRQRYGGVTRFRWLCDRNVVLAVLADRLVLVDAASRQATELHHGGFIDSAEPSPRGDAIAFASGQDLWIVPLEEGRPGTARRITADGGPTLSHGVVDQVTAEEIYNGSAYLWAPAGDRLLLASFDTAAVELMPVVGGAQAVLEQARYARPGGVLASFAVSIIEPVSGRRRTVMAADARWPYFLGFASRNADEALLVRMSRDQTVMQWLRLDWRTGAVSTLLERCQTPWINAPGKPVFRPRDGAFFLIHEDHGSGRIGLFDGTGAWQHDIGAETGHVESLLALDVDAEGIFFVATGADPRERHLFHAGPRTGWASTQLTQGDAVHAAVFAAGAARRLHTIDTMGAAPAVHLENAVGGVEHSFGPLPERAYVSGLGAPRLVQALAADGRTRLYGAVYAPADAAAGSCPVVLLVYGGPHVQVVRKARALTLDLRAQWLVQCGYVVVKIDNRGTSGRGQAFERAIYGRLGQVEVADQCAALAQVLAATPQADPKRIGVCGWSYGGYMALRCLQLRPDLFCAAVAGAPVVRWEDYDAPYTERYMGTPTALPPFGATNAAGYRDSVASPQPDGLRHRLLLIHGLNDENVLFRHSAALIEDLAAQCRHYELLLLPNERHSVRAPGQRVYLEWRIQEFLDRALQPSGGRPR
jgi:dipeptidyl-peptidase-4